MGDVYQPGGTQTARQTDHTPLRQEGVVVQVCYWPGHQRMMGQGQWEEVCVS